MTKPLSWLSFVVGAVIIIWMGTAFMGTNLLALVITCAIASRPETGHTTGGRIVCAPSTVRGKGLPNTGARGCEITGR